MGFVWFLLLCVFTIFFFFLITNLSTRVGRGGVEAAAIKSESVSKEMVCAHTYACASLCLCDLLIVYNGRAVIDSADGRSKNTSHLQLRLRYIYLCRTRVLFS